MAGIKVYNTMTQQKEKFVPLRPGQVRVYVCGVTPYSSAHLGHARPNVIWDVIIKFLHSRGYQTLYVQNFTDVDDQIIERARDEGVEALEFSNRFIREYLEDMDALGVKRADVYPKVSDHIPEIIDLIRVLIEKGHAYSAQGDVFFHVNSFPGYGKLSKQKREELLAGTRFEVDPAKRDAADFALWKKAKEGEPAWDSPWGPGRPGWHIECSAMSYKYLGETFDFHGGGSDLIFPHHENEIAQSEAATGSPLARYWVHNGMINFKAEKMSKSIGNVISIGELVQRYPAELIRFYLLSTHYRSNLEYYQGKLEEMSRGWTRLVDTVKKLKDNLDQAPGQSSAGNGDKKILEKIEGMQQEIEEALADDFNTAMAIGVLFELVREINAYQHHGGKDPLVLKHAWELFKLYGIDILGIVNLADSQKTGLVGPLMELLLELREELRKEKNFPLADKIRERLGDLGVFVEDTPQGPRWKV
ncbi:MAG: cysteine--tRNA ligase [Firmicutes bacterium]|nr:cysteine--tRNA ligase [Bacillota bacterium]